MKALTPSTLASTAAAVMADDLGGEDLAGLEATGQDLPAFLAAGAVEGDDAVAFGAHRLEDHDADGVAGLQAALALDAHGEHLALGDDGLGLGADIDDDAVGRGAHDDAFDDLAAAEAAGLGGLGFEKGGHVHLGAGLGWSGRGGAGGAGAASEAGGGGLGGRFGGGGGIGNARGGGRVAGGGLGGLFVGGHWWAPFDRVARLMMRREDGR